MYAIQMSNVYTQCCVSQHYIVISRLYLWSNFWGWKGKKNTFQEVSPILQVQVEGQLAAMFSKISPNTILTMTSQTFSTFLAIKETAISWPFKLPNDFKCYCPVMGQKKLFVNIIWAKKWHVLIFIAYKIIFWSSSYTVRNLSL